MLMELSKKGKFTVLAAAASNPGRCGAADTREYNYEVKVALPSSQLDKDDFVMDHNNIQKFFDDTFNKEPWILSCEMIACRTVMHFFGELEKRNVQLIDVNIIAATVNHRCTWDGNIEARPRMPVIQSLAANIGERWSNPDARTQV